MNWTVDKLSAKLGGTCEGRGEQTIKRLAGLTEAGDEDISFLSNPRYARQLAQTRAGAVLVGQGFEGEWSAGALIRVENPDAAFARLATLLGPPTPAHPPGIDETARIAPDAVLGKDVHIGPWCVIESGATIGDGTVIEAQCFVGLRSRIGAGSHLYPQVVIRERVSIGCRFIAHSGVVVGSDGFGYAVQPRPGALPRIEKIPQIGTVVIGDHVELGANVAIDRARFGETRLGNHVKIDNLVQIGHNVQIGDCSGIVAQSGIAGSTHIGAGVMIWAQVGVSGHLKIGDGAQIGPQAGVARDVPGGEYVIGTPAVAMREFVARSAAARQVEKLKSKIARLEARMNDLLESRGVS